MDKHSIENYNKIKALFLEKDCILITTYEAFFNTEKINCKSKYKIISKCGHETNVMMTCFKQHGTGIICSKCLKENEKSKENSDYHFNETFGINILKKYINDNILGFLILNEGTNADIVIKPKNIKEDLYLPIQIKTIEKIYKERVYKFTLNKKDYNNMLVILICIQEEKIWIIDDYSNLKKNHSINISKNSKYNRYYTEKNNDLTDILLNHYNTKNYNLSLNKINTPIRPSKQKEMYYKKLREDNLSFINFTYDDVQHQSYDFKINNKYKIQEKVAIINKTQNDMRVNLQKGIGGRKKGPYAFGDNDYYGIISIFIGYQKKFYMNKNI